MNVFIPLFFNAPLGGLQSHARRQAEALLRAGHHCTIMCKPGPFADSLRDLPLTVMETDFGDPEEAAARVLRAGRYDLVHAHPFRSSAVGLAVARKQRVPFLVTFHGTYGESLPKYAAEVDLLIAVSGAIRDFLVEHKLLSPDRIAVIPNGVDTQVFFPHAPDWQALRNALPALPGADPDPDQRRVLFVSRLDEDKQFMLDLLQETWEEMERRRAFDVTWLVAGDGTRRAELEALAVAMNQRVGRQWITFVGWCDEPTLRLLYNSCHLAIAPGRSALEAMACAKPAIALGSKGYVGLIDSDRATEGAYGNFGGLGRKHESYQPGSLFRDLDRVVYDDQYLQELGRLSLALVNSYFRQDDLDQVLLKTYEFARTLVPRSVRLQELPAFAPRSMPPFRSETHPDRLASPWSMPDAPNRGARPLPNGQLLVRCQLAEGERFYLSSGSGSFDAPPGIGGQLSLEGGRTYQFKTPLRVVEGQPAVTMWVLEYDGKRRLTHSTLPLRAGENTLLVRAAPDATCFRVAFRFSGSGVVELGPLQMLEQSQEVASVAAPVDPRRHRELPAFHDYQGENLVFIIGPPRSGTTWLLNLLRHHPQVVAATVDNLDARINDLVTLETNIFNDNRPFTDNQIKWRFWQLSTRHPGKVVVEKTPAHLLFVDRIRRVFPRSALVLVERDGRDIVTSLVHVGRDPSAWWQGAPDTVEKAARLWRTYAEAGDRCTALHHPYIVRYESLLADPQGELMRLQSALGLENDSLAEQIEAARDGRGIPMPGVFREGKSGGWRGLFTPEDVATFKQIAGDWLIRLRYEQDDQWGLAT